MKMVKINLGRVAFLLCNFVFLVSGISLVFLGCVVLNDSPRILLSRLFLEPGILSQPLLYYVALALIAEGLIVCLIALLGCWTSCHPDSTLLLGFYTFLLILLLLAETSLGSLAVLCPQIVGISSDRDQMVAGLMNNYGLPGRSQYTAAVDLAQTLLECCGMQSGSDYDGSKWWKREQETGHDLRVPHSCCFLSNIDEENAFLNPKPKNSSLCQAKTNSRYQHGRYVKGCIDKLNDWFKEHVTIFLTIGLALVVIQLAVLLCALLECLRKRSQPVNSQVSPSSSSHGDAKEFKTKKHKNWEKNQLSRTEGKDEIFRVPATEENGITVGKSVQTEPEMSKNSMGNIIDYPPKKLNLNLAGDFGGGIERRNDSPSSLPLVLRNEHFQRFEECKSKRASTMSKRDASVAAKYSSHRNEGADVYFTPRYNTTGRYGGRRYNEDYNRNKSINGDVKSYFYKSDKYGLDNGTYESYQDT